MGGPPRLLVSWPPVATASGRARSSLIPPVGRRMDAAVFAFARLVSALCGVAPSDRAKATRDMEASTTQAETGTPMRSPSAIAAWMRSRAADTVMTVCWRGTGIAVPLPIGGGRERLCVGPDNAVRAALLLTTLE